MTIWQSAFVMYFAWLWVEGPIPADDPVKESVEELFQKSDAVLIVQVESAKEERLYKELDTKWLREFQLKLRIASVLKGEPKIKEEVVLTTYTPSGEALNGNFGSYIKIDPKDLTTLHLLYLKRKDERWVPTSGYRDGGNSHFALTCSGFFRCE